MKILSLDCAGVRGVPDGTYAFTDPRTGAPQSVVLVTGGPASGKTSLLEAVVAAKEAVGSYGGPFDPMRLRRPGTVGARITAKWLLSDAERDYAELAQPEHTVTWALGTGAPRAEVDPKLRRLFSDFSRAPGRGKLEYFPASRALVGGRHPAFGATGASAEGRLRTTVAPDKYACVLDGLREAALRQAMAIAEVLGERGVALRQGVPDALAGYRSAVATMLQDVRLHGVDLDSGQLRFERRARGGLSPLAELSESERQGVLFALAFGYLGLNDSLVLVDEPELHIHATDRVRFLQAIAALGKDNQIIVATGASELIHAAVRDQTLDLSMAGQRGGAR